MRKIEDYDILCYFVGSSDITVHYTDVMIDRHGKDEFLSVFYPNKDTARIEFYKQKRSYYLSEINKAKRRIEKNASLLNEIQYSHSDLIEKYPEEFI
jgi:hypothetical protein